MRFATVIAGASALGPILGLAAVESINTVPKQSGADVLALLNAIPRHEDPQFGLAQKPGQNTLPDHYPLVTPRGTVQVAELWLHGVYRNRRPARFEYDVAPELYEFDALEMDLSGAPPVDSAKEALLPGEEKDMARDPAFGRSGMRAVDTAAAPNSLLSDRLPTPRTGPKIVDVAAVLAGQ